MIIKIARLSTLIGYFGLLGILLTWNAWIAPSEHFPRALILMVLLVPLLFPLRGLLHGRPYTHAWTILISLIYFTLGVSNTAVAAERLYGLLLIIASLMLFSGCILYLRCRNAPLRVKSTEKTSDST